MAYLLEQSEYNFFKSLYDNRATTTPSFANLPAKYQSEILLALGTVISDADTLTAIQTLIALNVIPDVVASTYTVALPDITTLNGSGVKRIKKQVKANVIHSFR